LSSFSKIFEIIAKRRILSFLLNYKFFSSFQYSFLPKKNADLVIFKKVKLITEYLEQNKKVACVYLDVSKAFDTIDHYLLLKKMEIYGFRGCFLEWLRSYLLGRQQCVKVSNQMSGKMEISCGVPQGSILGPLLFLIFSNDLLDIKTSGHLISFADDTILVASAQNEKSLIDIVNSDMSIISSWFINNKLLINFDKTKIISYGYKNQADLKNKILIKISKAGCIQNKIIEAVDKIKYLGLVFDCKRTWSDHTSYLQKKLRKINYLLYYLKMFFQKNTERYCIETFLRVP